MAALETLLATYRQAAATNREAGTYFEDLTTCYFQNEPAYRELYRTVEAYASWASRQGSPKTDTGIDLVAETFTGEFHAIQCKLFSEDHRVQKSDIDRFFTASGKKPFTRRYIVATTDHWTEHAEEALRDQQIPVTIIDLHTLENSAIDWSKFAPKTPPVLRKKKSLREDQQYAVKQVIDGFETQDRGKLIMACGTGKTLTSLKIAETIAGAGKRVLFLVPSLALLSQTLTEWTQQAQTSIHSFAVCSDSEVGKRRPKEDDVVKLRLHELSYPATTDPKRLAIEVSKRHDTSHTSVVFATYHSIGVVHESQRDYGLPAFDLIVCDEAHRTTGATFEGQEESHFVRVHDAEYIHGEKRLYMTATPRIYGDVAKATAAEDNVALCSMDDEAMYGKTLSLLTFSDAVKRELLVDYKVVVVVVDQSHVSSCIQELLKDANNSLRMHDAATIVGCWKALSKQGLAEELVGDCAPMQRAVAFCQVIEPSKQAKVHKVSSMQIAEVFQAVVEEYQRHEGGDVPSSRLRCEVDHVDGSMNASVKEEKLKWLKREFRSDTCRILSNVRCLSEGVDVPALDAVLFLTPRNSQVDVVQSVGRVMRKSEGKKRGYIILPVVIPAGVEPHKALDDNRTYQVVWQVLQAVRSHDDRFDAMVNKLELDARDPSKMEVIVITDRIRQRQKTLDGREVPPEQQEVRFATGEIERAMYAKLVDKVGNRHHWADWAKDVATIAQTHITRITGILDNPSNTRERAAFEQFAGEIRQDLNDSVTREEIIEMLAQHLVTKPVFDALFSGKSFAAQNSMFQGMQGVLDVLQEHHLEKEADTLTEFYESVKMRASGIESAEGKQKIVVELYDRFFRSAFPKMSERLGIVYTPVEIVDFVLKSVDYLLRTEFGQTLGGEGVHVLDPFTGTGTFVTRMIQSGLISKEDLPRKYASEIQANEIVLLAYYIAAINIEMAYHGVMGGEFVPFGGICWTDTFQMSEREDVIQRMIEDNSRRRVRQKGLDIRVIVGNPPYSVGQGSENDNNQNVKYPMLDQRIRETYAGRTNASNKNSLYDSYVRAIRWASDRIGNSGIVGFVTNAGFIEAKTADGLRKCLGDEFSSLYIFHLRGNLRTSSALSKKEGGPVFASSRVPAAISFLLKNPKAKERGVIHFHAVGDYVTRDEKLATVAGFGSISGIAKAQAWTRIVPDAHGDWVKQRDDSFASHIVLGTKDKADRAQPLFVTYSRGLSTCRDAWAYSPSKRDIAMQMRRMIDFYNTEVSRFDAAHPHADRSERESNQARFVNTDSTRISWTRGLKVELARGTHLAFEDARIVPSLYRPFAKQWLYFDRKLSEMVYQLPRLFVNGTAENRIIMVKQRWDGLGQLALLVDVIPDLQSDGGTQCFPLYVYDTKDDSDGSETSPFAPEDMRRRPPRQDGITNTGLAHFQAAYPGETITKEDVFYYVYGMLHSSDYRERYKDNLGKELPRIPRVRTSQDFWAFSKAGRALGELHVGYEAVSEHPAQIDGPSSPSAAQFRVEKMKFGKGKDKTTVHYNQFITVREIPLDAYHYVVNGKSAIEWVMERQSVTVDKASGIKKDANDWALETAGDPRYPLSLLLRVITVSLETIKIVNSLPKLDIFDLDDEEPSERKVIPFRSSLLENLLLDHAVPTESLERVVTLRDKRRHPIAAGRSNSTGS